MQMAEDGGAPPAQVVKETLEQANGKAETKDGPWLNAWYDPVAGMPCFSQFMAMADLHAEGDHRLVMVDLQKRIRIYKGTSIQWQQRLLDQPTAVQCVYHEVSSPPIPTVAIASGECIYIYRYLRPYLKFTMPQVELDPQEVDIWAELVKDGAPLAVGLERLTMLREKRVPLSNYSIDLLALDDLEMQADFVKRVGDRPLEQHTCITCMDTLKANRDDVTAVSLLVVGSENKLVCILDSQGMRVMKKVELESVPAFLNVMGKYEVDYRITVACRDGKIFTIKNGQVLSMVIELETQPVGLQRIDKSIWVATMDQQLHCYHVKGKKNSSMAMPHPISCMTVLSTSRSTVSEALIVCLNNGEVRLYNGKYLVHTFSVEEQIMGCKFGTFGREEGCLILSLKSGGLVIKILNRNASLDASTAPPGPPPEQDIPLDVPKKTKLYVEQTTREKENAIDMHRIFQRDLCKLRLSTARAYVKLIGSGQGPMSYGVGAHLRLNAEVRGMGPEFSLLIKVQNTGVNPLFNVPLLIAGNAQLYHIPEPCKLLPAVIPHQMYPLEVDVICKDENGGTDTIRLYLCKPNGSVPILTALVQMPICEPIPVEG
jgi:Bardet-Biedl syndrome 1 protein